jgi:hypothetical protein
MAHEQRKIRMRTAPVLKCFGAMEPTREPRIHVCGAHIHSAFTSRRLALPRPHGDGFVSVCCTRRNDSSAFNILHPRRIHMNVKRILGFAAIAGLLAVAAPTERAQALSLSTPGAAAAVQDDTSKLTTEVRWHRHWGWRRHHWRRHHWHRRHWRRW